MPELLPAIGPQSAGHVFVCFADGLQRGQQNDAHKDAALPDVFQNNAQRVGIKHQRRKIGRGLNQPGQMGQPRQKAALREEEKYANCAHQVGYWQIGLKDEGCDAPAAKRAAQSQGGDEGEKGGNGRTNPRNPQR